MKTVTYIELNAVRKEIENRIEVLSDTIKTLRDDKSSTVEEMMHVYARLHELSDLLHFIRTSIKRLPFEIE